jgi:1-aminocyclopropane-1-carboxylate deaminase/D-cysteine desulfhydrase-like pyridoxal-dependent ACC family enzyme
VRVVDKVVTNVPVATMLANRCAQILSDAGIPDVPRLRHADITILDDYIGPGYGEPTALGLDCLQMAWDLEDLELDPTYTAKAFAALHGERERLELRSRRVLYWHTLSSVDLTERIRYAQIEWDLPREYQKFF